MAAVTSKVTCPAGAYTSLGTSTSFMWISPGGRIQIVAASSQPAPSTPGHGLNVAQDGKPFYLPFATQVWAQPTDGKPVDVIVTF